MYEVGRAGGFVSERAWRRHGRGVLLAAVTVALGAASAGGIALAALAVSPAQRALGALLAVAAGTGCAVASRWSARTLRPAGRAAAGTRPGRRARAAIRRTAAGAAAYGVALGDRDGDCGAVVVTRWQGTAAVEVRPGDGRVTADGDAIRVGRRVLDGDPARRAADRARWLADRLDGADVLAVVCVPGMTNRPFTASGVLVCGARDVRRVLRTAPRVFGSPDEARRAMERLWQEPAATTEPR
ncbi:hypothetical protein [Actinomadura verrucosospora]|uniref:NERD domain-containing protein n=1 Tax=Actinomadura verrucosospora TaxID=46165 RepID=A0A7D3VUI1_ACTVE|nr:hypothetical protein [Actinomadura verrucosospora]QKG23259.1 hypothetical protein ACTIVE_4902 [Actinomadura verrucosospora]